MYRGVLELDSLSIGDDTFMARIYCNNIENDTFSGFLLQSV